MSVILDSLGKFEFLEFQELLPLWRRLWLEWVTSFSPVLGSFPVFVGWAVVASMGNWGCCWWSLRCLGLFHALGGGVRARRDPEGRFKSCKTFYVFTHSVPGCITVRLKSSKVRNLKTWSLLLHLGILIRMVCDALHIISSQFRLN